jgi:hypothetical protein
LIPPDADGRFDLLIDNVIIVDDIGDGGDTGPVPVSSGPITVSETASGGGPPFGYISEIFCMDNLGPDFWFCSPCTGIGFDVLDGPSEIVCTITNTESPPTAIELTSFTATPKARKVKLGWSTGSEIDNLGFNLYRAESEDGEYTQINGSLILAEGSSNEGSSYEFVDRNVRNRKTYWYRLEDVDIYGTRTQHGPVSATPRLIYLLLK